jgi:hypothetical protein
MDPGLDKKPDAKAVREWLKKAETNPKRCFLCFQIWLGNRDREGSLAPIKLAGIQMTREMQISHLAHCLGGTTTLA